jgi:hypothetical protein
VGGSARRLYESCLAPYVNRVGYRRAPAGNARSRKLVIVA